MSVGCAPSTFCIRNQSVGTSVREKSAKYISGTAISVLFASTSYQNTSARIISRS